MILSKLAGMVRNRAFSSTLALMTATTVQGQTGNGAPRSPGGRYYDDSSLDFGAAAENARLREWGRSIKGEQVRLDKDMKWLNDQYVQLDREKSGLDDREAQLSKEKTKIKRQRAAVDRRKSRFRCSAGLTIEGCLASPPVHPEVLAFIAWYRSQVKRLDSQRSNNSTKMEKLKSARRSNNVKRSRVDGMKSSYQAQLRDLKVQKGAYQSATNALRSRRSPDEGLFIDESVPRSR
jgi:chromosome segregation ATPase